MSGWVFVSAFSLSLLLLALIYIACDRWQRHIERPVASLLSEKLRQTFMVTLLDGSTFHGVLARADAQFVVLVDATTVITHPEGGSVEQPVDGELLLPRAQVSYLQRP